jgi:HEAT repeat protein
MSDNLKKLTGKNPKDFEPVACSLINNSDVELFAELVEKDDFLFDFVKQNVASRIAKYCNNSNYLNLLSFLKFYSPSYEEVIVSTLAKFADEDLTDKMLELFENGTDEEKTYCAKFFSCIQDSLALDLLRENSHSENSSLSFNCATTLGILKDEVSYNEALKNLQNIDEFAKLDAVKFLVAYGNKGAVPEIIDVMKQSSLSENIAGELVYLCDLFALFSENPQNALLVFNSIINGLGEILSLGQVFDFQVFEFIQMLLSKNVTSASAVVLLNAKEKFETLTENDEYLFDESKDTKNEVFEIKNLLLTIDESKLLRFVEDELVEGSPFVFTAIEFVKNPEKIRNLLTSKNPTLILKALEVLKGLNLLTLQDKNLALDNTDNEDIKIIITAM